MKVRIEKGLSGLDVKIFTPETDADLEMLKGMEERGLMDRRTSFHGDMPEGFLQEVSS